MDMNFISIEELKKGYIYNDEIKAYICNYCNEQFQIGEVYQMDSRFFTADKAVEIHLKKEHGNNLEFLMNSDNKYNTLTENQKKLLLLFGTTLTDNEIAKKLEVSPSTVRHQKFNFREKAKQAKMYLAMYELALKENTKEAIIPIHNTATMVDSRYVITEKEKADVLRINFVSLSPLILKSFPKKEKKKIVILNEIVKVFENNSKYSEKEVNSKLGDIYKDFAVLRRYLVDYGFMDRTVDGKEYWIK